MIDPHGSWIAAGGDALIGQPEHLVTPRGTRRRTEESRGRRPDTPPRVRVSPRGDFLAAGTLAGVRLIPMDGRPVERLVGFNDMVTGLALDPTGRQLAAGGGVRGELMAPGETVVRVWNLDTREVTILDAGDGQPISSLEFMPDGRLLSAGPGGVRLWNLQEKTSTFLIKTSAARVVPSPDGRYLLLFRADMRPGGAVGTAIVHDVESKRSWDLTSHGSEITSVAWAPSRGRLSQAASTGLCVSER